MMNTVFFSKRSFWLSFVVVMLLTAFTNQAEAQRQTGEIGIGFQVGQPTGLSLKTYKENGMGLDFLMAWDLGDFFFLNVHGNWEKHLDDSNQFHFYYGPGVFIGFRDSGKNNDRREDVIAAGISAQFGLNFMFSPSKFEIFVQGTPRFELIDRTRFDLGGGAGMRYYF